MQRNKDYTELLWCVALALLIPIWIGLAPDWYKWYAEPENGRRMKWLYSLLDGRWLVNIPVCVIIGFGTYRFIHRIWKDNDVRYYRPVLVMIALVILYVGSNVKYAKVLGCVDYRQFLTILLVLLLLTMTLKVIFPLRRCLDSWKEKVVASLAKEPGMQDNKEEQKGFSDTKTNKANIPESLKNYAGKIVERLLVTDIKGEAFALGVTGEWGVGKTTFLGVMKDTIKDNAEIVDFNPWMCSSPEQVIDDFFASLCHKLSPKYSTLSKSIKEYAQYLKGVSLSPHSGMSLNFLLPVKQESISARKDKLSKKFAKLPRPVVVVIDDIDRLEQDEVFEVLRLIRNTADLNNVLYMVAYDKDYVTCVLEKKHIKDASAYLEKIFPVEVHLPKVEEHLVWNTLFEEIKAQSSVGEDFAEKLSKRFEPDDKKLILTVLDNYRRAKRFARLYMLNMAYLNQNARGELKLVDVFWLELLQMYDKKTYDVLADEPGVLLYSDGEKYRIKDGILKTISQSDNSKYEGEAFWKEETPHILEKLFGHYIKTIRQSICFTENYEKYFTLSVSPFRLSIKEMNSLFEKDVKPEALVDKWVNDGKYFDSIAYQYKQVGVNRLNDENLQAYLHGLLWYCIKVASYRSWHMWEVKKMLMYERYKAGVDKKAHDIVVEWFGEMMKIDKLLPALSKMLHRLYITITVNHDGKEESLGRLLISNDEVECLLVEVMKTYLAYHGETTALDLMSEKGVLPYIFGNCCVVVRDATATENYCEYRQVAFEIVTAHFAAKEVKPSVEEYDKALGDMFKKETPEFDDPYDEGMYWDYASEAYDNKMQEYFGSGYDRIEGGGLVEFKKRCFVEEDGQGIRETESKEDTFHSSKFMKANVEKNNGQLNDSQKGTLGFIKSHEGYNTTRIAEGLGKLFKTVGKHIIILLKLDFIERRRSKKTDDRMLRNSKN